MHQGKASGSQLVIYPDGTLYHIDLKRDDNIPKNLFFVGAAGRAKSFAKYFDEITFEHKRKRVIFDHENKKRPEFHIVAGKYKGIPMAAMSCGIGVDNIEIVITELHALFEYDHISGEWTDKIPNINIIRVGSCGTSLPEISPGAIAISDYALGLDNLGAYYPLLARRVMPNMLIESKFLKTKIGQVNPLSYCSSPTPLVVKILKETALDRGEVFQETLFSGITTASPGFFGPEGRQIGRIQTAFTLEEFLHAIQTFDVDGKKIINHEMEVSILFRIAYEQLGYNVGTICLVLDNLETDDFLDSALAEKRMDETIKIALEAMVAIC